MKKIEIEVHEADRDVSKQIAEATLALVAKKMEETGKDPSVTTSLFSAAMSGLQTERFRVLTMLDDYGREAATAMHRAGALAQAARLAGAVDANVLAGQQKAHEIAARTVMHLMEEIARDPASCPVCKGRKNVESTLLAGGRVACEVCGGTGKAKVSVQELNMTIDGFVPQCENCDEAAAPEDPVVLSQVAVRRGLCAACRAGTH